MDDRQLTTLLEHAYPVPNPELPNERVRGRARALRRRRRIGQAIAATTLAVAVVVSVVVVVDWHEATKISVPPATRPHEPAPNATVDHELLVTPSTGLRDGQPVRVSGRHFVVGVGGAGHINPGLLVATCRAGATWLNFDQQCDSATVTGTSDGDFRTHAPLRRPPHKDKYRKNCCVDLVGYHYFAARRLTLPSGPVDCALDACVVLATGVDGYAVAPVHFDPNAASLPVPRVTVSPSTDLQEGQQITVHIEDAWPGGQVNKTGGLCLSPGAAPVCDSTDLDVRPAHTLTIDRHGRATGTMVVKSTVLAAGGEFGAAAGVGDCAQAPGCVIKVQVPAGPIGSERGDGQVAKFSIPITFSAAVRAQPFADRLPHATIDTPGPYADGQEVTIAVTRLPKGTTVRQCAKSDSEAPAAPMCDPVGVTGGGTIVLHRYLEAMTSPLGSRVDCSEPGRCTLSLTTDGDSQAALPAFPLLEFAPLIVN
jgi:hypothetical protein